MKTFFKFSDPEGAARLILEEQRDHLLAEAKPDILKQQRQAHLNRLEMDSVSCGYEESRRESMKWKK